MEHFRTLVEIESQTPKINYDSKLIFMGSCFATNIGSYFSETGFNTIVNPFGVLYNPISIAKALERLILEQPYKSKDLVCHNQIWQSFDHHSQFNHADQQTCLNQINQSLRFSSDFFKEAKYLFITFGTSWIYQLKETGSIVSNCHKFPASTFNRFLADQAQVTKLYQELIDKLLQVNPDLTIILTISPVRHWKDGAHGNQISKAILLLSVDELCRQFNQLHYFPAYELLLDDLRDYRFFADDMLHPSATAINYIRSKFKDAWLNSNSLEFINNMESIQKALAHRPFNIKSEQHQHFIQKTLKKLASIQQEFPSSNLTVCSTILKNQLILKK